MDDSDEGSTTKVGRHPGPRHPTFDPEAGAGRYLAAHPASDGAVVDQPEPPSIRHRLPLTLLLLGIVIGGAVDLALDAPEDWTSFHVVYEVILIGGALGLVVWLWRGWWKAEASAGALRQTLAERQAERDAWRARARRALEGLGQAVEEQFEAWRLTPAEREVALLLLKGHGHKQIAAATGRSERTVRQHAVSVYQKSGLQGRAELAAFFLEDLTVPLPAEPGTG
jgi:DNA-binding CsgD family transcriptional regulator